MNARNNMRILRTAETESAESGWVLAWGPLVLALILAAVGLALVWFMDGLPGLFTREAKLGASVWIFLALVAALLLHVGLLFGGAYRLAGRIFRADVGDRGAAVNRARVLKRDARLQDLCDELRATRGWLWRYRTPWLLVHGPDERVDAVAPGLKQAGVLLVADTVLVHAAPAGIEAGEWRRQLRRLRRHRPVDRVVHVMQLAEDQRTDSELPRALATLATDLGWAAPVTFLHAVEAQGNQPRVFEAIGVFPAPARRRGQRLAEALSDQLAMIGRRTADAGVQRLTFSSRISYLAHISQYIDDQHEHIVAGWHALTASPWLRAPLAGVLFAPVFATPAAHLPLPVVADGQDVQIQGRAAVIQEPVALRPQPAALLPTWRAIASRRETGRRVGFYWPNVLAWLMTVAAIAWCAWMTVSFLGNRQLAREAQTLADAAVDTRPQTAVAWRAQLALQQFMEKLEYREQHGAPWYLRAGLSHNDAILAALWQPYQIAATRNLQVTVVKSLEEGLRFAEGARADALQSQITRRSTYNALKTYLMLADPSRADPVFLKRLLVASWGRPVEMPVGERDDTGARLAGFYAEHLKAHPEWRITPDNRLVMATRNMLVTQMGLASSDDTLYQGILDEAKGKYANASLETLLAGTNVRGLFTTSQTVPGIYTRAAWDGMIADAIARAASGSRVSSDWVLTGSQQDGAIGNTIAQGVVRTAAAIDEKHAADALKQRLTARYFAEYTAAWQTLLNSIRWQPAANLNDAIGQLTQLADAQTSPLIVLMKAVLYQAQAGRSSQALTDTLVRKAQSLVGSDDPLVTPTVNPLDQPFGPLLALMGDTGAASATGKDHASANVALNGVSLSRYLTAVTTMRLKLQQIAGSADAQSMARALAQAVFQGKLSELSQARDDAALTAASLGSAWAGFGDAVFTQPLDGAWQTILQPAAASLNEAWRASVAAPFNAAMSGRYPFFDTNSDASFAELGRYVRPDTGLIARFMSTQLAGVLKPEGDHWTRNELAPQALQFDPKFLSGIRQLATLGAQLYVQGDAGERFEMMALPTPNVTRSELSVDGRQIVYFNQQESWTPLAWPGDGLNGHAGLTWQTLDAGLRQAFDSTGDWAFLRLLGKADVKPLDSTRYQLTWNGMNGEPLAYVLRTQLGAGPLDLLKLRGFRMPERIFVIGKAGVLPVMPPLPPDLQP